MGPISSSDDFINIISAFLRESLMRGHSVWRYETSWEGKDRDFFMQNRSLVVGQLFQAPAAVTAAHRGPRVIRAARWVLVSAQGEYGGWAEAEAVSGHFGVLQLLIHLDMSRSWVKEAPGDFLSLLVSAAFLSERIEVVRIIPVQWEDAGVLLKDCAAPKVLWTPYQEEWEALPADTKPFKKIDTFETMPSLWWDSDLGRWGKEQIGYLSKRHDHLSRLSHVKNKKDKRFGIFRR